MMQGVCRATGNLAGPPQPPSTSLVFCGIKRQGIFFPGKIEVRGLGWPGQTHRRQKSWYPHHGDGTAAPEAVGVPEYSGSRRAAPPLKRRSSVPEFGILYFISGCVCLAQVGEASERRGRRHFLSGVRACEEHPVDRKRPCGVKRKRAYVLLHIGPGNCGAACQI